MYWCSDVCSSDLAGVLLDVRSRYADAQSGVQVEVALLVCGQVVLGDLVVLRLVRVEVVLPREHRAVDAAGEGSTQAHGQLHRLLVGHWQRTGQTETGRAGVDVRLGAAAVGERAEAVGCRVPLPVELDPYGHSPTIRTST